MVTKYIVLIISIFLYAGSSFAQNIADDYFEEDDGYTAAHQEMPANHTAEDASGGYQFKNDALLSEQENQLVQAVFNGEQDTVKLLLDNGTNPNLLYSVMRDNETIGKTTLLHLAIAGRENDIFKLLIACKDININQLGLVSIKENNTNNYKEITPLAYAFYLNHLDMAEVLLEKGADPNKYPAVFFASNENALNLLNKYHADMNILNDNKSRPLFEAVKSNKSQLVSLLIKNGADINKHDGNNNTLLYTAISLGYFDMARFLIDNGADINAHSGKDKITPLMAALARSDHDAGFLRYIIFKGADVSARDAGKKTPLFYVYKYTDAIGMSNVKESIGILMENKADINAKDSHGNTILHIKPQDYYQIYSAYKPDINIQNTDGNTPLHIAAMNDNVKSILTGSPDRKIKNKKGKTALDIAKVNHFDNTTACLELSDKESLLMLGAEYGDVALVDKAVEAKLDVNKKIRGHYPVYYAAKGGNPDVFIKLIIYGAKINLEPNLIYSVMNSFDQSKDQADRVRLANIFIEKQASLDWEKYNNLLHLLVKEQSEENKGQGYIRSVLNFAIANKADVNVKDNDSKTPLHIAAGGKYESYDLVLELISGGADVDITDKDNNTALYYCANAPYNKNEVFAALLNNTKTDINARYGEKQNTLLMEAAANGNKMITMMLIARGADDSLVNADNKTALILAKEKLALFDTSSVDVQNSAEFQNYKFIADKFLSDKNTVAECRSGINEDCKKYYKPVDVIKTDK